MHNCSMCSSWRCIQEISDDLGRHRSDAQVNNAPVTVLRGREEGISQWKHLQPGDLVKVCSFALNEVSSNELPPMVHLQWIGPMFAPNDQEFESDPDLWQLHVASLAPMLVHTVQHGNRSSLGWQFGKLSKFVCLCVHEKCARDLKMLHTGCVNTPAVCKGYRSCSNLICKPWVKSFTACEASHTCHETCDMC